MSKERVAVGPGWASWEATPGAPPDAGFTPARVLEAARRHPGSLALVGRSRALTYEQLAQRAWAAARRLRALGVASQTCVALVAAPSPEMVVAQLAIGIAGAGYLPLDPSYPLARLRFMVKDSAAALVLDGVGLELGGSRTLALEPVLSALTAEEDGRLPRDWDAPDAHDLAYLIYTSGSTGVPKGVMVEHGSLLNYVLWKARSFSLGPGSRVSQVIAQSFDMSVWEIWPTLSSGASLHFAERADYTRPGALFRWMAEERISLAVLPTPLAEALLKEEPPRALSLRHMLVAGDRLRVYPGRARTFQLWNLYGPTEATINVTCGLVPAEPKDQRRPPSIGHAIAGAELFVLNGEGQVVPEGQPGELHIGGPVLARGYHARPALTAERFVASSLPSGGKLYRTGDLVRREPDGSFEFLGRIDQQVKLRGYRIELGEIEAVLNGLRSVKAAVVLLQDEQLVAYVVRESAFASSETDCQPLSVELTKQLPAYMVPSRWVTLRALPLTPNGKIDRARLCLPESTVCGQPVSDDSVETRIAQLWCDTLSRESVGADDDYFALGGHSLSALGLLGRLESTLGIRAGFSDLVEAPTLARFSARLRAQGHRPLPLQPDPGELVATEGSVGAIADATTSQFEPFPLTDVQHAYWLGRERAFELGGVATHLYFEREAELDLHRLERALQRVIAAHPMLRAVVRSDGMQQVLADVRPYEIRTYELRESTSEQRSRHFDTLREELSHQVLAPAQWPLFDIRATSLPRGRVRLHLSFDALIVDAQSLFRIFDEWHRLYVDETRVLLPTPASFRDYVVAWTMLRESPTYAAARSYWQARVPDLPSGPELPLAQDPGTCKGHRFVRRELVLPSGSWQCFRQRAHALGLTETAALLTAYADVLARFAKSPHFLLNLTLFNRLPLVGSVEDLVGDFTSITLLEVDGRASEEFAGRAARLQRQLWRDLDHRIYSGVQVLRDCAAERRRCIAPVVFTSELGFEGLGRDTAVLDRFGDEITALTQTPQVWIDLQVMERSGELIGYWDAVDELFPPGVLGAMFEAFRAEVTALAGQDAFWRARRWSPSFRADAAPDGNDHHEDGFVASPAVSRELIHAPFVRRALESPARPALLGEHGSVSYGELLSQARRVAHGLVQSLEASERLVAVVVPKSPLQIVAVLAVLLSGRAYVPLEVSWPAERRAEVLGKAKVRTALVGRLAFDAGWPLGTRLLVVDDERTSVGPELALGEGNLDPGALAYVMFTSGSTGSPKGVMIAHQAAHNTIDDINDRFSMGENDRALALSSLSFDLSVYDIFGPLGRGGAIVLPPEEGLRDPKCWRQCIERYDVTVWNSVPQLAELLIDELDVTLSTHLASLRLVLLSGDWIPVHLPARFWRHRPGARMVSLGGATEGSIWSIVHPIETVAPGRTSIPYGRALRHQQLEVWDAQCRRRPPFVVGELYIGGLGVAEGYVDEPERTAQAFIRHPDTGERWYRTGDLGRYLPNGEIEFLGREDGQLKINGYRVELGEVEAVLLSHPAVTACCVAGSGERGQRRLVAGVVLDDDAAGPSELRAHLERRLPAYMVPAQITVLQDLPLTANGKVDRAAVAALPQTRQGANPLRPAQGSETHVAAIWADLLKLDLEHVSVTQNFFDLGGDSVSAIRLRARLADQFGIELPVVAVFEHVTVRRQAAYIEGLRALGASEVAPAGRRAELRQAELARRAEVRSAATDRRRG